MVDDTQKDNGPLVITANSELELFQIISAGILVRETENGNITEEWASKFVKEVDKAFDASVATGFVDITLKEKLNA